MESLNRRDFIKAAGYAGAVVALGGHGLAFAADDGAEQKAKADAAVKEITGGKEAAKGSLTLVAPDIAENGAVVPVSIEAKGFTPTRIALIVDDNPVPLIFEAKVFGKYAGDGAISSRIRMRKTSTVRAYAYDGKGALHGDMKTIKVTIGGCG
jgi:sulfur-oxidizing protein SoxY